LSDESRPRAVIALAIAIDSPGPVLFTQQRSGRDWAVLQAAQVTLHAHGRNVSGRSHNPFEDMLRIDYQYVAGWALARDVENLLATLPAVISGRGAH
jgi:lipopolysaccharide/colanic/teichoic acid biosynthesis glycosyltransferase